MRVQFFLYRLCRLDIFSWYFFRLHSAFYFCVLPMHFEPLLPWEIYYVLYLYYILLTAGFRTARVIFKVEKYMRHVNDLL